MEDLNYMPEVEFIKVHPDAILPSKAPDHDSDTAYDLYCVEDTLIPARGSAVVPIGIKVGFIPEGYWFRVEAKSGLSFKHGLIPHPGVIDNGYRGDMGTKIYNLSDENYRFNKGDKVAQIAFYYNLIMKLKWGTEAKASVRGEGGFGSTGR
jgi:dUTP pyrophosphatase